MRFRITRGLLFLLSLFILVGLSITQPPAQAQTPGTGELEEIVSLRARNRKVFRHVGETQVVNGWEIERHTMEVSLASLHFLDENGQWQDVDTTPVDAGTECRVNKVNVPVRLPKAANSTTVIKTGDKPVTIQIMDAEPVAASRQDDRVVYADVFPQTDIAYQVEADSLREFLTLKGPGHPTTFIYQVGTPLEMRIEDGDVVFRNRDGQPVGQLVRPFVLTSSTETRWGSFSLEGNRLVMTIPDLTGLSYPITVDPTFYGYINNGGDDGYAVPQWTSWNSGDVRVIVGRGCSGEAYNTALRWPNTDIPQGTEFVSADVRFRSDFTSTADTPRIKISAADEDNPSQITSYSDWNNRPRTATSVSWTLSDWTQGSYYYTPDLANVVQAAVNRGGFDGTLMLLFDDDGSDYCANRSGYSYEGNSSSSYVPRLWISYNVKTSYYRTQFTDRANGTSQFYMLSGDISGLNVDYAVDKGSGFDSYTTKLVTHLGTASPYVYCSGSYYWAEGRWRAWVSTQAQNIKWRVRVPSGKSVRDSGCTIHSTTEDHSFWVIRPPYTGSGDVDSYTVGLAIWP